MHKFTMNATCHNAASSANGSLRAGCVHALRTSVAFTLQINQARSKDLCELNAFNNAILKGDSCKKENSSIRLCMLRFHEFISSERQITFFGRIKRCGFL